MSANYSGPLSDGTGYGTYGPSTNDKAGSYFQMRALHGGTGDRSDSTAAETGGNDALGNTSKQGSETPHQNENGLENLYGVNRSYSIIDTELQRPLTRLFDPKRQLLGLLAKGFARWTVTVLLVGAVIAVLKFYNRYQVMGKTRKHSLNLLLNIVSSQEWVSGLLPASQLTGPNQTAQAAVASLGLAYSLGTSQDAFIFHKGQVKKLVNLGAEQNTAHTYGDVSESYSSDLAGNDLAGKAFQGIYLDPLLFYGQTSEQAVFWQCIFYDRNMRLTASAYSNRSINTTVAAVGQRGHER
ncbi:hypothetical protein GP486_006221 [Trichoglossum hirsutum]|uniref:Uncharacterized protein n=1 Tax=Trichoglossum hirsutum TaxID=265104 RepID=A0A9P8IHK5_9PEZI|nr:hypothetical protein GP486_006221 [Trichoglossum hirsutum]